jgi:hypothetical protein
VIVRFEVLTAVLLKIEDFCYVTQLLLINNTRRFGRIVVQLFAVSSSSNALDCLRLKVLLLKFGLFKDCSR